MILEDGSGEDGPPTGRNHFPLPLALDQLTVARSTDSSKPLERYCKVAKPCGSKDRTLAKYQPHLSSESDSFHSA